MSSPTHADRNAVHFAKIPETEPVKQTLSLFDTSTLMPSHGEGQVIYSIFSLFLQHAKYVILFIHTILSLFKFLDKGFSCKTSYCPLEGGRRWSTQKCDTENAGFKEFSEESTE